MSLDGDQALDNLVQQIQQRNKSVRIDMIIVLLPSQAEETRNRVKFWGDVKVCQRKSPRYRVDHEIIAWDPHVVPSRE